MDKLKVKFWVVFESKKFGLTGTLLFSKVIVEMTQLFRDGLVDLEGQ